MNSNHSVRKDFEIEKRRKEIKEIRQMVSNLKLQGKNSGQIFSEISNLYPKFSNDFKSLTKLLVNETEETKPKNDDMLKDILDNLEKVQNGETTLEEYEEKKGKELANKFLPNN